MALVHARFWPAVAAIAASIAIMSSGVTIYTVWHLEDVLSARSDEQLRQLSDRMNDAITMATARADAGDAHLDKRIDAMKARFDPLPSQIEAATQDMRRQVAAAIASMKAVQPPASTSTAAASHDDAPGVKRKKSG